LEEALDFESWRSKRVEEFAAKRREIKRNPKVIITTPDIRELLIGAICANDAANTRLMWSRLYPGMQGQLELAAGPVVTLAEWCARNGASCVVIEPAQEVHFKRTSIYGGEYKYNTVETLLASLPNARWVPGWDYIIADDGSIMHDSGYLSLDLVVSLHSHCYDPGMGAVAYRRPSQELYIDEEVIFISAPPDVHMGHWICDFLPRLIALRHCNTKKIAVPSNIGQKHIDTLIAFGVEQQDILICDMNFTYKFKTLHFYRPGQCALPHPTHCNFIRTFLSRHTPTPRKGKRIFLSRSSVGTRGVTNSEEFEAFLQDEGFLSVEPADLSIAEQQTLFADAEILLGVFGSNLIALYLAPPGCKVICMFDEIEAIRDIPWLPASAAMFQQEYQNLRCDTADVTLIRRHKKDRDIVVDCQELRQRLAE
jgi:hypothetical protein